jgi:hypothetical protein
MDLLVMGGMWAAALLSLAACGKLILNAFVRATRSAVSEEFVRIWKEMDESDKWHEERFARFEASLEALKQQVSRLEALVQKTVEDK